LKNLRDPPLPQLPDGEATRRKKQAQHRLAPKQGTLSFECCLPEISPNFPAGEEPRETVAVMRVPEAAAGPGRPGRLRGISRKASRLKSALASPPRPWRGLGSFPRRLEGFAARRGAGSTGFARQRCVEER
jgi:hypothetical protein